MAYHINGAEEMAAAALASGTHRVEIKSEAGQFYAELVEREEPDPDVLYMKQGKKEGPFVVCPTPFRTPEGQEIEVILTADKESPVGFNVLVNLPTETGGPNFVVFDPRK